MKVKTKDIPKVVEKILKRHKKKSIADQIEKIRQKYREKGGYDEKY